MSEIFLSKKKMRKDAFVFINPTSVNNFIKRSKEDGFYKPFYELLRKAIHNSEDNKAWKIDCLEVKGGELIRTGDVIAFEKVDKSINCPNGINCWVLGKNAKITIEDGIVYTKPVPTPAIEFTDKNETFNFIKKYSTIGYTTNNVAITNDTISLKTNYGVSEGYIGDCYVVCYGQNDFNIFNKNTPSFKQYDLLT